MSYEAFNMIEINCLNCGKSFLKYKEGIVGKRNLKYHARTHRCITCCSKCSREWKIKKKSVKRITKEEIQNGSTT